MAILVTGGTGYIGSHTVVELLNKNKEVIIVDNLSNSKMDVIDKIEKITSKRVKFYKVDLLNEKELEKVFEENSNIDSVIHFAALKAVGESVKKPIEYYNNNLTGTLNLLNIMRKYSVKKLVFSSSATVYGIPKKCPITEDMPLSTTNPYGTTKLMIEQILRDVYISDNTFTFVILRYFNPIGAHESTLLGDNPNGIPNNLMPYISRVASGKLEKLSIFGDDYNTEDGTGVRDYIHVVDLAKAHVKAISKTEREEKGVYTYNIGTGKGYSVLDLVHAFEKENKIKVPYVIAPRRAGDIATCYADPTKAEKELGFKATKTLEDMVRDTWNFEKNN